MGEKTMGKNAATDDKAKLKEEKKTRERTKLKNKTETNLSKKATLRSTLEKNRVKERKANLEELCRQLHGVDAYSFMTGGSDSIEEIQSDINYFRLKTEEEKELYIKREQQKIGLPATTWNHLLQGDLPPKKFHKKIIQSFKMDSIYDFMIYVNYGKKENHPCDPEYPVKYIKEHFENNEIIRYYKHNLVASFLKVSKKEWEDALNMKNKLCFAYAEHLEHYFDLLPGTLTNSCKKTISSIYKSKDKTLDELREIFSIIRKYDPIIYLDDGFGEEKIESKEELKEQLSALFERQYDGIIDNLEILYSSLFSKDYLMKTPPIIQDQINTERLKKWKKVKRYLKEIMYDAEGYTYMIIRNGYSKDPIFISSGYAVDGIMDRVPPEKMKTFLKLSLNHEPLNQDISPTYILKDLFEKEHDDEEYQKILKTCLEREKREEFLLRLANKL